MIRGVRGATTLPADTIEAQEQEVIRLMTPLIEENGITEDRVLTLFITVTDDIKRVSPAKMIRQHFGWQYVPIMCAKEPDIEGMPERCIRVLIQFETERTPEAIRHVYLNEAAHLRPDR